MTSRGSIDHRSLLDTWNESPVGEDVVGERGPYRRGGSKGDSIARTVSARGR